MAVWSHERESEGEAGREREIRKKRERGKGRTSGRGKEPIGVLSRFPSYSASAFVGGRR